MLYDLWKCEKCGKIIENFEKHQDLRHPEIKTLRFTRMVFKEY